MSNADSSRRYLEIVRHYEACLLEHGDSHAGVDWPNRRDAELRYAVMLELLGRVPARPASLLDFGCGASHFYEYLLERKIGGISYSGLDISALFVELSRQKFPNLTYYCLDILQDESSLPAFDYVILNGVFTEKRGLTYDEMFAYFRVLAERVFAKARKGMAFNVLSKHVDWERDDLFHLPFDALAHFVSQRLSRHFTIRSDYGLYEYTAYVYRDAVVAAGGC